MSLGSLATNFALLCWLGVRQGGDSIRYIKGAADLLAGNPLQGKQSSYLGYVTLVAISQALGGSAKWVVAFQICLASLAAMALYDMGRSLAGTRAGLLAAGLFIVNVDIARWHVHVLTDSAYISLVVCTTWFVHRAAERGGAWYLGAALLVFAAAFVRPNGWILIAVAAVYWISRVAARPRAKIAASALVLFAFAACVVLVGAFREGIEAETPGEWLRKGVVIWGDDRHLVSMPVDSAGTGLADSLQYVLHHPLASARLATARVGVELAHVRPAYSAAHNGLVFIGLALIYPMAWLGFRRRWRDSLVRLAAGVIASHLLIVGMTFADWDGRFLLYVFPLICLSAACEIATRLFGEPDGAH